MVSVFDIKKDNENVGFVSVRLEDNAVYILSSSFTPLEKKDLHKIIQKLQEFSKQLK